MADKMNHIVRNADKPRSSLAKLTADWGDGVAVSLYLKRCRVDTPNSLIKAVWRHVADRRSRVGKVVDFGAGDGRFSASDLYDEYFGYEIDQSRCGAVGPNAVIRNACAFSETISDADLCIGNPPFVRNQDLPDGWRHDAASILQKRTGVKLSGLANAWQYFFLLGLASIKPEGLCVLIIPFEWVSRPSAKGIREHIKSNNWHVDVYKLVDHTFSSVLTTASITVVDKSLHDGLWRYHEETDDGKFCTIPNPGGADQDILPYARRSTIAPGTPRAVRGLSPGTQKGLVLTEGERVSNGLKIQRDVLPCVTSLRPLPHDSTKLDQSAFDEFFRKTGQKCWLIRTDRIPSKRLTEYLASVPREFYQTKTCLERDIWWKFNMPNTPNVLMAQMFKKNFPKAVANIIGAKAVGSVCGVYDLSEVQTSDLVSGLDGMDISNRIVSYANGLRKIEINQLNWILQNRFSIEH